MRIEIDECDQCVESALGVAARLDGIGALVAFVDFTEALRHVVDDGAECGTGGWVHERGGLDHAVRGARDRQAALRTLTAMQLGGAHAQTVLTDPLVSNTPSALDPAPRSGSEQLSAGIDCVSARDARNADEYVGVLGRHASFAESFGDVWHIRERLGASRNALGHGA